MAFLPGAPLGILGGALFGPVWGSLWNLAGATLGATVSFLAARYVGAGWVQRQAGPRLEDLLRGVEEEGWRFVALVRLVPIFPFNLSNYALGLTGIGFRSYVATTFLCMIPGTFAYTYLGYAGREAMRGGDTLIRNILIALGLFALALFLPRLVRRFRSEPFGWIEIDELEKRLEKNERLVVADVRGADEFTGPLGHIPGALNIPIDELPRRFDELVATNERAIVLVCKTDRRSATAAKLLRERGFENVTVLRGGMEAWRAKRSA